MSYTINDTEMDIINSCNGEALNDYRRASAIGSVVLAVTLGWIFAIDPKPTWLNVGTAIVLLFGLIAAVHEYLSGKKAETARINLLEKIKLESRDPV